jgi:1,2-diacylglycerol 3-beta-galactosyltransferase
VIVSTHPLFHQAAPMALRDLGVDVPIVGVVTDLFTLHRAWLARGIETWVAPTEAAREFLLDAGVDERRIHLLGLPIDPAFAVAPAGSRERRRAALGLDPKLPVVLLVGGGEGVGGLAEAARALMDAALPAQVVAVTGRNRVLQQELLALKDSARLRVHVEGFVTNMPQWMHAADVVVTKAGPGTVTEAMACGLPLILTGAVPGQEEGNVTYVLENELGVLATTPVELLARLEGMLRAGDTQLARMAANARRLSRPHAASDIARLVFASMPAPDAPSIWEHTPRKRRDTRRARPGVLRLQRLPPQRPQRLVGRPARPLVMRAFAMRRRGW